MQLSTILQGILLVLCVCCASSSLLHAQSSPSTIETLSGLPNDYVPFKYKGVFELYSLTMLSGKDQAFGFIGSETLNIANPSKGTLETILNLFDNYFYTGTLTANTITGDYFFADRSIIYVMRVKTGKIERVAGGGSDNNDDIPAIHSNLNRVNSMFFDESSNTLFLSQEFNVRRIDLNSGLIFTVCGRGEKKFTGEPMLATDMKLLFPSKVLAANGEIYISDEFYYRIFKIKDGIISNFAGNGKGKRLVDGDSASGSIDNVNCDCTISKVTGDLFFGCSYGIFKLSKSDQIIYSMTSNNTNAGKVDIATSLNPDDGQLSSNIYINQVQSILMDNDGIELYFSQYPGRVTRITNSKSNSKSDWKLQTILGSKTYLVDGIPSIYARTSGPNSAAIVGSQVVFPQQAKYIRQVPLNGIGIIQTPIQTNSNIEVASSVVARYGKYYFYSSACQILMNPNTVIAGNGVCRFSPDGSSATTSSMNQITFMTISKKGQLFFIEPSGQSFLIRTIMNGMFKTIAGGGSDPYSSNIPALNTLLSKPSSLSFSPDEQTLYISDNGNNRIKSVNSQSGMLDIIAGNVKANFTNGIPSRNASLDGLSSLIVLPSSGDIILTERNHVRRINSQNGRIYSLFGSMFDGGYTKDGPFDGEKDKLYQPIMLDVDPEGTNQLLIQDFNSLRKMMTQCKQGYVLNDDWSRCLPCPNGMKSNLDFTMCL